MMNKPSRAAHFLDVPLAAPAVVRAEADERRPEIRFLSWDCEGTGREVTNLLSPNSAIGLRFRVGGEWKECADLPTRMHRGKAGETAYTITLGPAAELTWLVRNANDLLSMKLTGCGSALATIEALELVMPFAPGITPTTALSGTWDDSGSFSLPAIISAPDFGQLQLTAAAAQPQRKAVINARIHGSRKDKWVKVVLGLAPPTSVSSDTIEFRPLVMKAPEALRDADLWSQARRGWFNIWQPSAQWGDQGNSFSAPSGVLANNVISDPASCSLWFYADQAFLTPELTEGVSMLPLVRRSLDFWLDNRMRSTGEMVCYWDYTDFLDAQAGPLIAAWDYVEASGDLPWLKQRLGKLEALADFLAKRDVDGDGLVEAVQSGNRGTLIDPKRSCAWWDALNCGHQDAYTNALIYRAWRCLADLEGKAGRVEAQQRYATLADRLKAAYARTLINPQTGWLAWWKSADGELHDYASPTINGLAIEYGLIEPSRGKEILARLRDKMQAVGFTRIDLGVPPQLIPVLRGDYLLPDTVIGSPKREDGTDTFGVYMNGGITAGQTLHFLAAHYVVGDPAPADLILRAMLARQSRGEFQNGVRDEASKGIDWTDWQGNPTGYEGYLADSFRFLQAVLLRDATFRERIYRPLRGK